MKIQREDVERMKDLAKKVSVIRDPVAIHQLETGFMHYMQPKYGEKTATEMLIKVWQLSDKLRKMETMA